METYFLHPRFDKVTEYSSSWCIELHDSHPFAKVSLEKESVRAEVESVIPQMLIICFYDHGSEDVLWGNDGKPLIDLKNISKFKGVPIYTLACFSSSVLGRKAIEAGIPVYFGYSKPFGFYPYRQEYFKIQASEFWKALERNATWKEAHETFKEKCLDLADELDANDESVVADQILWNLNCAELLGAVNLKVKWGEPAPPPPPQPSLWDRFKQFLSCVRSHIWKSNLR